MNLKPIFWSAQACPFRRAGVYYGLSEAHSHAAVAELLLPKRGVAYPPTRLYLRPGEPIPLAYFAVRDPSAVRVVPARAGGRNHLEGELAHVSLVFSGGGRSAPRAAADQGEACGSPATDSPSAPAAFLVTVGLRTDREAEFHERLVLGHTDRPYAELCERIMALRGSFPN